LSGVSVVLKIRPLDLTAKQRSALKERVKGELKMRRRP
jgi:hypothetical protein